MLKPSSANIEILIRPFLKYFIRTLIVFTGARAKPNGKTVKTKCFFFSPLTHEKRIYDVLLKYICDGIFA